MLELGTAGANSATVWTTYANQVTATLMSAPPNMTFSLDSAGLVPITVGVPFTYSQLWGCAAAAGSHCPGVLR
jgi:hypothetical protein